MPGSAGSIVVVGSGSLARAVCYSLAVAASVPVEVLVVARSQRSAEEVCFVANARAQLSAHSARFASQQVDLVEPGPLATVLAAAAPDLLLGCASYQSPWERRTAPSAWTALVQRAGFGVTLPLQAAIAVAVGRAVAMAAPQALYVNACYPDAVNPVLHQLRLPVFCGIGNVSLVATSLRSALDLDERAGLRVLAHHYHLGTPDRAGDEALAWLDDRPVPEIGALLAGQRATRAVELNTVTGHAGALLLLDLLTGRDVRANLPGPLGLPGGYPVAIRSRSLALDLPSGWTPEQAVSWNQRVAELDGARIDGRGNVHFAAAAERELAGLLPEVAGGFPVSRIQAVCEQLRHVATRLRAAAADP